MTAPDPPDTVDALRARLAALEAELAACHRERDDLHRDAQRLRALTDSSPAAVAFVDGTRLVYINPAGQVITGFSQEELLAKNFWDLAHPDERAMIRERGERRVRGEPVPDRYEMRIVRKDGEVRWVELSAAALPGVGTNGSTGILISAFDVTNRVLTEQALRESEARWRSLIQHVPAQVLWVDRQGTILFANRSQVGDDVNEVIGRNVFEYADPEEMQLARERFERVFETGQATRYEHRVVLPDGSRAFFVSHMGPVMQGDRVHSVMVIAEDVTERRQAEKALHISEARWRSLIDHAPVQILLLDREGRINFLNRLSTGDDPSIVLGTRLSDHAAPAERARVQRQLDRVFAEGSSTHFETTTHRLDGSEVVYSTRVGPIRDGDAIRSAIVIVEDVTERRAEEQRIADLQAELVHVHRLATLNEVTSGLAHEINNPLTAISNWAEVCVRQLGSETPDLARVLGHLDDIKLQAERASDTLHGLREFARGHTPRRAAVDLRDLIAEVILLCAVYLRRWEVEVNETVAPDLPPIEVDRTLMQQVILNLLRNAAEAMSGDGAPREAGHRQGPRAVWITARRDGEAAIVISVRDNGPGISPRIRGTLFDHFVTTRPGGLGMGLAISRSIVEAHEGRLWVDPGDGTGAATGKGAGATFHISLPIRSSRSPAPETGPGEPASQP